MLSEPCAQRHKLQCLMNRMYTVRWVQGCLQERRQEQNRHSPNNLPPHCCNSWPAAFCSEAKATAACPMHLVDNLTSLRASRIDSDFPTSVRESSWRQQQISRATRTLATQEITANTSAEATNRLCLCNVTCYLLSFRPCTWSPTPWHPEE